MTFGAVILVRLFLTTIAFVLLVMASVAWSRRRRAPEATLVALLLAGAGIYCFGYAGEVAQTTLGGAIFWLHVEYLGIPWIPALWLVLARKHTGLRCPIVWPFVIPVLTFLGQWTNSLHGLYDHALTLVSRSPFWVVVADRGPIAWLNIAYIYAAFTYGAWLYLTRSRLSSLLFRMQTLLLVASCLPPLAGYLLYLLGGSPWGLDLAPITLGISVVMAYVGVFKLEYFDLVPMARSLVFNSMRDAALVTDLRHRLVDFNPAAEKLLPCLKGAQPGDDISDVLAPYPALGKVFRGSDSSSEVELTVNGEIHFFDLRLVALKMEKEHLGWAAILANVTNQHQLIHALRRDAETDELTGVANRRGFLVAIERESTRAMRYFIPYSVILVDIDHFKRVNDRFGHPAGDRVLYTVVRRILECLRGSDLLSRYGGDEFAILLTETNSEGALEVADRIRRVVANCAVQNDDQLIEVSISIGVATHDPAHTTSWEQLLEEADQALYRAKAGGRNKVATWGGLSGTSASSITPKEEA